ncbi:MAG: bacteriochlorophyll 4-vinyl reductase [Pseudomonadota bacterium]
MPEGAPPVGHIGPNAILQVLPVLKQLGVEEVLDHANVRVPDGHSMVDQAEAARLHRQVRKDLPETADEIAALAGRNTGDYILKHRIPKLAQTLLKLSPPFLSAAILSRAIAANAWTFVGSGEFETLSPWQFRILKNPLIAGEESPEPLCVWHAAVFERLYQKLVHKKCRCIEATCAAQPGQDACMFVIYYRSRPF